MIIIGITCLIKKYFLLGDSFVQGACVEDEFIQFHK